jgi:hypothetical protein
MGGNSVHGGRYRKQRMVESNRYLAGDAGGCRDACASHVDCRQSRSLANRCQHLPRKTSGNRECHLRGHRPRLRAPTAHHEFLRGQLRPRPTRNSSALQVARAHVLRPIATRRSHNRFRIPRVVPARSATPRFRGRRFPGRAPPKHGKPRIHPPPHFPMPQGEPHRRSTL